MKIDMHIHSSCSDGEDSIAVLYARIIESGIQMFALTDHDTVRGVPEMMRLASGNPEVVFIPGIEISCLTDSHDLDSDCHILGLGVDVENEQLQALEKKNLELRHQKLDQMLVYLEDTFGIRFSEENIQKLKAIPTVGKTDVRAVLYEMGLADSEQEAYNLYLKEFKSDFHITSEEAIQTIKAAGGIPVWAHPMGDEPETEAHKTPEEFQKRFIPLLKLGIEGLECCYSRYTEEEEAFLIRTAEQHNLYISAGSDYHGEHKKKGVYLGKLGVNGCKDYDHVNIQNSWRCSK